ncbi:MAG: peptidylprolyl isomerase [Alphaproteobacteria bacterium]
MSLRQEIRTIAAVALLAIAMLGTAQAQEVQRIIAVVNDEAVSNRDVIERVRLVVLTSGLNDSPELRQRIAPQVLRTLIDEHLRLQEAERKNVSVTDREIRFAISIIEQRNSMPADSFVKLLESRNIDSYTLETKIRAEIAWNKLVNQRLRSLVTITDEDIDDELRRLRDNRGKPEFWLSEIFLTVDGAGQDKEVRKNAGELVKHIRAGANFANFANQFSVAVSASDGGSIGWVTADQIDAEVAAAVANLQPGEISNSIATRGGYLIVRLDERRQMEAPNSDDAEVDLRHILLATPGNATPDDVAANLSLASVIRETVADCDDMVRIAAETDPTMSGNLGMIKLKDMPPNIRTVVEALPIATASEPVTTDSGVHLFMVCDRVESDAGLPRRIDVRQLLIEARLDQVARHYLRDLRRTAFIDIRT